MGNLWLEWVASTLHTTSEHGATCITTADAHNSAASNWLNWRPRRFKWTHPFRRKTKSCFCACAITFQLSSARSLLFYVPWNFYYFVLWPTNAQLFHKLSHSYMFRHYRVFLRDLVINTLLSYISISNSAVSNTIYNNVWYMFYASSHIIVVEIYLL